MVSEKNRWTLDWVRERVRQKHHRILTKYLLRRDQAVADDHLAAGWSTDRIVREGFDVKEGQTAVPQAAIKCLRNCSDLDPRVVRDVVLQSKDFKQHLAFEAALKKLLLPTTIDTRGYSPERVSLLRETWIEIRNRNTILEVMES